MALRLFKADDRIEVADLDLAIYEPDIKDGDSETVYTVRVVTPEELRRLRQPHVTWRINRQTHQREEQISPEAALAFADELIDRVLVAWRGVEYDGQPVPCERDYKVLLDPLRKSALVRASTSSQVQSGEDLAASFRGPADVRGVVGRRGADAAVLPVGDGRGDPGGPGSV